MIQVLDFGYLFAASAQGKIRELLLAADPDGGGLDDATCVRRARDGDGWAEEALYRRHAKVVAVVVTRLLSRSHEAEDVVQDAFLAAFRNLAKLEHPDRFRPWVIQIAVHLVHRRFRRRRVLEALALDTGLDDATLLSEVDPRASPETRAEISKLDELLRTLPADGRIAWILRFVEGYKHEEVAEACRCSVATAKRRIARTHEIVRRHLVVSLPGEE